MTNKKPPFEITNKILPEVVAIGELVGRESVENDFSTNEIYEYVDKLNPYSIDDLLLQVC